ncbi:hypothetical protein C1H46_037932 [Malus baccata]|uniref:Uncharacterized protein n=1 Tax=Malus baccata TaxID=106549 RepID=A0A540KQR2_MALBA|nr:hypothetical protein C1H46_037932 [Malus baccata]
MYNENANEMLVDLELLGIKFGLQRRIGSVWITILNLFHSFCSLIVASNFSIVKEVEAVMDPAAFTIVRFAVSAIPFIPFVFQARGDAQTCKAGIELGLWVSLGYLMQALGLQTSDAGRASFQSMFTVSTLINLLCIYGKANFLLSGST